MIQPWDPSQDQVGTTQQTSQQSCKLLRWPRLNEPSTNWALKYLWRFRLILLNSSSHSILLLVVLNSSLQCNIWDISVPPEPPSLGIRMLLEMPAQITSWNSGLRRCVPQPIKMYHQKYFLSEKKEMTSRVWRYSPSTRSQKKLAMTQYWKKTIMALQPTWKRRKNEWWTAACFHSKKHQISSRHLCRERILQWASISGHCWTVWAWR